jgi:hypothetical protein
LLYLDHNELRGTIPSSLWSFAESSKRSTGTIGIHCFFSCCSHITAFYLLFR